MNVETEKCGLLLQLLSPLPQLFPNLGTIKRGKSYRPASLEFFLNSTDTHVNDFNDGVLHTLAQPNIRVQACSVPGTAFAGGILTEP